MRGAIPPETGSVEKVAQDIIKWLKEYGVKVKYIPVTESGELDLKKLDDLILFVGRLEKSKGVHLLLQALLYLKIPTQVVIIGPFDQQDPHYSNEIKKICFSINEKGLHKVELLGSLNESELLSWYQKAAVLVRPDLEGRSGGLTSLEALACGTPMIGTGNDIVKDKVNGKVYPQGASNPPPRPSSNNTNSSKFKC
jgi:glycosyltransferase involved in cell wall biosynthesis